MNNSKNFMMRDKTKAEKQQENEAQPINLYSTITPPCG